MVIKGSRTCVSSLRTREPRPGPRKETVLQGALRSSAICPFTLEATRDCAVRRRSSRSACHYSLEACIASR